jgi:putative two-component system response regulator
MAERLGLPAPDVALIREAAPLHDIGKLSVPDAVLLKPGDLNADEFEVMKEHTTSGAAILAGSRSEVLRLGEEIALTHHEWWDGNGYPRRLREDDIPASGQIVAVADVFDALTHDRPYKQAWPLEAAVAEIRRLVGTQFSPRVVEAFETLDHAGLVSIAPFGG